MPDSFEVYFPPRELSPNARPHFHAKARKAKQYRRDVMLLARAAKLEPPGTHLIGIKIEAWPRSTTPPDDDNVTGAFKAGRDGIADALGIDDKRFRYLPVTFHPRERGKEARLRITLHPLTDAT